MEEDEEGYEHKEFYQGLHQNLDEAYRNVEQESLSCGSNVTATELHRMLNIRDNVWNEADKGLGFILIPCKKMLEAEEKMRGKLEAEAIDMTNEEVS